MKESRTVSFSKAIISKEDGKYIITEVGKDDSREYNLSEILDNWLEIEDVKITISKMNKNN